MGSSRQRVVVKTHYVKMGGAKALGRIKAHLSYLQREGVSQDGDRGVLYGADGEERASEFLRRCEEDPHQFRFILSPERGEALDLTEYTKLWMRQVEQDLGTKLDWVAVNHYNTDNPHVHVLLRGVDGRGEELRIDRAYMSHGMRHRAEELATAELGPRTQDQMREARRNEIEQLRYTSLDRGLEQRGGEERVVDLRHSFASDEKESALRLDLMQRARFLSDMGLAHEERPCVFALEEGLKPHLVGRGKEHDIIAHLHQAGATQRDAWCLDEPTPGDLIQGKVVDRGLVDELKGREYVVVEDERQKVHHLELGRHWERDRAQVGDWLSIKVSEPEQKGAVHLNLERHGKLDELVKAERATWLDGKLSQPEQDRHPEVDKACRARQLMLERLELVRPGERVGSDELYKRLDALEMKNLKKRVEEHGLDKPILATSTMPRATGVLREEVSTRRGRFVVLEAERFQLLLPVSKELRAQLGQRVEVSRQDKGWSVQAVQHDRQVER
jgi:type IV secretory pathway VirD2 relaxase